MAEIRTIRTARKPHRCDTDTGHRCRTTIQPGQRYLIAAMPPNSELGNTGWWVVKICQPCAEQYGTAIDEQATPLDTTTRARRPRTRAARHRPARRHVDEPRLHRPVVDVHLPAHDIA
ncbi:hypothetical protein ACFFMR_18980 [Micromonospora andamanensis]|uniref:Uncharacterized protein n=1 Tax=Micromonospora andamanensis TaxID=1287068 RepID=A0ABQ4HYR0_9ACTN|nr:hypothetical protein [Micromonospora andamanensis]GIJ10752.1 hypothetical protein Van01_39660 [Micromonospora andamanensis]